MAGHPRKSSKICPIILICTTPSPGIFYNKQTPKPARNPMGTVRWDSKDDKVVDERGDT
jgi:hypothetical protein